jgi:two-component sensor histidine kinase
MSADWNEADRLAALHSYRVVDTQSDADFIDFVQIASEVCKAPVALVSLIDTGRQWFAAELGLGIRETPLDMSICAHAILQRDVFVVPDLALDSRFDCNPLVTGEAKLRFYAGALLKTSEGLPLGTICILDTKPRPAGLTERQRNTLKALARQVMVQLELRRALAEKELLVQEVHHRVKNSLTMVQSLLTLQARAAKDEDAAQQLRESASRVRTFGAMHEHLYRFSGATEVDLAQYLGTLLDDQQAGMASTLAGRTIALQADTLMWPAADTPQVGLVALELVTNALKYGSGEVRVTVRQDGESIVLSVEDDGTALPADFDPSQSHGLGMRLVTSLLQARGGKLCVSRAGPRTCFVAGLGRRPQVVSPK